LLPTVVLGVCPGAATEEQARRPVVANAAGEKPSAYYFHCLAVLGRRDPSDLAALDLARLRRGYFDAVHEGSAKAPDSDLESQLGSAFGTADWALVIRTADAVLAADVTRIRAHMLKAIAQERLDQDATYDRALGLALAQSILASGDGRSPETAFHVFFVHEEYDVLGVLRLRPGSQSLTQKDGRHLDLLTATDDAGNPVELYFDITEHMTALRRQFEK
jgi:hypothetical protein